MTEEDDKMQIVKCPQSSHITNVRGKQKRGRGRPRTRFLSITTGSSPDDKIHLPSSSRLMRNLAEKQRRDKLNGLVAELALLVPQISSANRRIDKTSVLRLAASIIRLHKIFNTDSNAVGSLPPFLNSEIISAFLESFGGFLILISTDGKILYVSDGIEQILGYTQIDVMGTSVYPIIHPEDHENITSQLNPYTKNSQRRTFACRMKEKALSRNDAPRYEVLHVMGQIKSIPASAQTGYRSHKSHDEGGESSGHQHGTHMLVSFARIVKEQSITTITRVDCFRDEYITRHRLDGEILYADHRISFVLGVMPEEVMKKSAFAFMHDDDILWSLTAQKMMIQNPSGSGEVTNRLIARDGSYVTVLSQGFMDYDRNSNETTFVCVNTVLQNSDSEKKLTEQKMQLLSLVIGEKSEELEEIYNTEALQEKLILKHTPPHEIEFLLSKLRDDDFAMAHGFHSKFDKLCLRRRILKYKNKSNNSAAILRTSEDSVENLSSRKQVVVDELAFPVEKGQTNISSQSLSGTPSLNCLSPNYECLDNVSCFATNDSNIETKICTIFQKDCFNSVAAIGKAGIISCLTEANSNQILDIAETPILSNFVDKNMPNIDSSCLNVIKRDSDIYSDNSYLNCSLSKSTLSESTCIIKSDKHTDEKI